jgi:hypothetical protein
MFGKGKGMIKDIKANWRKNARICQMIDMEETEGTGSYVDGWGGYSSQENRTGSSKLEKC